MPPQVATPRDENNIPALLGVLNTDTVQGQHLVPISINGPGKGVKINTTDSISFTMVPVAPKDPNYVNCWLFQGTDGLTYPAVVDADGRLLVDIITN